MRVWIEIPAKGGVRRRGRELAGGSGMEWVREMDWVRGLEGARSAATLVMAVAKAMVRSHMFARAQRPAGAFCGRLLGAPARAA